jgi:glutaredoxin
MIQYRFTVLLLICCLLSANVWAVKIYECEDELGNRSFEQQCPPGTSLLKAKQYSTTGGSSNLSQQKLTPLVLYLVPDCDSCDQLKEFLSVRNIAVTEKNVSDAAALQQELKGKTGGDLRVPVLLVGEKVLSGYNRSKLIAALTKAGYISEQKDSQ